MWAAIPACRYQFMKKILILLTTVLALFCFCSCSAQPEKTNSSTLDSEQDLEGLRYAVAGSWKVTEMGTTRTYSTEPADDLPLSVTVAAMDAESVAASQDAGLSVSEMLVSALGVESSGIETDSFKGVPCEKFEGIASGGYDAEGYIIPGEDYTYILMGLSTNLDDDLVEDIWDAFLDSVTLP